MCTCEHKTEAQLPQNRVLWHGPEVLSELPCSNPLSCGDVRHLQLWPGPQQLAAQNRLTVLGCKLRFAWLGIGVQSFSEPKDLVAVPATSNMIMEV